MVPPQASASLASLLSSTAAENQGEWEGITHQSMIKSLDMNALMSNARENLG